MDVHGPGERASQVPFNQRNINRPSLHPNRVRWLYRFHQHHRRFLPRHASRQRHIYAECRWHQRSYGQLCLRCESHHVSSLPLNGRSMEHWQVRDRQNCSPSPCLPCRRWQVSLNDSTNSDSNELYLRFGSPPTREDYDYRYSDASAADQSILVPKAAIGTWYVLVYTDHVPVRPVNSRLSAERAATGSNRSTPAALGNSAPETLSHYRRRFRARCRGHAHRPGNTQIAATTHQRGFFTRS